MENLTRPSTHLRIGCWNIQGLLSKSHDKTNDECFLDAIKDNDIVGLTETHTVEGGTLPPAIGDFETHYFHRPKHTKAPHGSGGIAILLKPDMRKGIKIFPATHNDYIWLSLDPKHFGTKQTVYVCIAYIPPPP